MLERTFIHARGVGPKTEVKLWTAGATDWDAFLRLARCGDLSAKHRRLLPLIEESKAALRATDVGFFHDRLPSPERWRLYPDFADRVAFVDIETTGLSLAWDKITVAGLYDGEKFKVFIRGRNLDDFPRAVARYPLVITFNGAQFDVPFLRATFPSFRPPGHVDLRFPLKRLGHSGGLKEIEKSIGLVRPREVRDVDGLEAVMLWSRYERGDRRALEKLIEYNRQDVMNLAPLAKVMLDGMRKRYKHAALGR